MADRNENEPFWTAEDVAEYIGCHPQTVYLKARAGEIPSYKIGQRRRFRPADVRAWAERHAVQGAA